MATRIVTDSNCDLAPEIIQALKISVVPLYINIGTESYRDGVDMSRKEFYEGLHSFQVHPTTSVPGVGSFTGLYRQLAHEGATQVLSIHIASSLSAMTDVARLAAQEVSEVPVTVFDSGQLTLGTGLLVMAAAKAAAQGQTFEAILALLEDQASRTHCFAALDTLEFLRRSGRLTRFQASLGSMLQVKPVIRMHQGEMELERVRTRNGATARLLELASELRPLEELALVHTHAPDMAEALRHKAQHLFPEGKAPMSAEVTPVIGAHIGPGAVGFVAVTAREN
jgi:DegV family protein with EDD domain